MVNKNLTPTTTLDEFFHNRLIQTVHDQKLDLSDDACVYLINILKYFSKSENLFNRTEDGKLEYRALALKLHDAVFAAKQEQKFSHLKSLGDTALYHAGLFYDGLYNQMVNVDYYINMGGTAYYSLANLSTVRGPHMADLFRELSEKFAELVEVLYICFTKDKKQSNHDILKLLERYNRTGSETVKEQLKQKGIEPDFIKPHNDVQ